jgi:4-phospho-D-threonate 3-dehydrogenase / 4-phospho-D-erythronate 3-dehydrogenase
VTLPTVCITIGDPLGSGPELAIKAALAQDVRAVSRPVVAGALSAIDDALRRLRLDVTREMVAPADLAAAGPVGDGCVRILPLGEFDVGSGGTKGQPSAEAGRHTIEVARLTAKLAADGTVDALASGPSSKTSMKMAGSPYEGVGEVVAEEWGFSRHGNMIVLDGLRMLLATNHLALAKVPGVIAIEKLRQLIELADQGLRRLFGLQTPRIAIAALNPHAGEGGAFGDEESRLIGPAIALAREAGVLVDGPIAADFVIPAVQDGRYDGAVMMYHDQAHVPAKALGRFKPATILLGLPHVRTSVAHGTVYGKAPLGTADPTGMIYACQLAAETCSIRP